MLLSPAGGALTAVSLFTGIGGIDLGLRHAGVHVTAGVEINKACRGVLARHFPQTAIHGDVQEVTGDQLRATGFVPRRGIIAGGWPCQGNSSAGKHLGMADPRSGLWRHVVRLLDETRPLWFIGENVHGLLSVNGGRDFRTVIGDLDDLGYGVAWRVLDAQFFGVPQQRRRVFIAGCLGDPVRPVQVLFEPENSTGTPTPRGLNRADATSGPGPDADSDRRSRHGAPPRPLRELAAAGRDVSVIPVALRGRDGGNQLEAGKPGDPMYAIRTPGGGSSHPIVAIVPAPDGTSGGLEPGIRRLTPLERERLQGFPDDWTRWRLEGGHLVEQPDTTRYHQTGNAAAVPVTEWIARRVAAASTSLIRERAVA